MKRMVLLLLVAFMIVYAAVYAENDSSFVRFGDLYGEVHVRPNSEDDDAYVFAELDTPLNHDDRIRTMLRSGAILSFSDMSTFVVKENTTIVLDISNEQHSKVGLLAGNIWVNLKRMTTDGSLEIEMSQAVAGLKGTNITCSSRHDEDRIQVLRGIAQVMIKETREKVEVKEGEELIVKKGGKSEKKEIDVKAEQKKWEKETSRLGDSIQMNEIPEVLKSILDSEAIEFARISENFKNLLAQPTVDPVAASHIQKDAERFIGILMEDSLILSATRRKVDQAAQTPDITPNEKTQMLTLLKDIAAVSARVLSYQAEAGKIIRYQFNITPEVNEELVAEIEMIGNDFAQAVAEVDAIRAVVSANPTGQGQDWFLSAVETCSQALADLAPALERVNAILAENPGSVEALAMLKSITDQQNAIVALMRDLVVVEVDPQTITELSQIDDTLSNQIVALQGEITAYDSLSAGTTIAEKENRFVSSVRILNNFAKVRRMYLNGQRLYDTTSRATAGSKYRTAEMEEVEEIYRRISDTFQQLGIAAEELELNIRDLESQLSTYLK
jgi:uncharacterized protein YukE/uncharacterized metal-binding protein